VRPKSLQTFCTEIFLSFVAYFVLIEISDAIWMQILVNIVGLTILTLLAWYKVWTTSMDKPTLRFITVASPSMRSSHKPASLVTKGVAAWKRCAVCNVHESPGECRGHAVEGLLGRRSGLPAP
jgi:OpgC protein